MGKWFRVVVKNCEKKNLKKKIPVYVVSRRVMDVKLDRIRRERKNLEKLESEILENVENNNDPIRMHEWAAKELKALSESIKRNENIELKTARGGLMELKLNVPEIRSVSRHSLDNVSILSDLELVKSESVKPRFELTEYEKELLIHDELEELETVKTSPRTKNEDLMPTFRSSSPIPFPLTQDEILTAKKGVEEYVKKIENEKFEKREILRKVATNELVLPIRPPKGDVVDIDMDGFISSSPSNGQKVKTAISSTCLPGDEYIVHREEINEIINLKLSKQLIILFSSKHQFKSLYCEQQSSSRRGKFERIYFLLPSPGELVDSMVDRRFKFTTKGFVEVRTGGLHGVDAVTLKG